MQPFPVDQSSCINSEDENTR